MKHFYLSVFALLVCITANAIETKQDTLATKDGSFRTFENERAAIEDARRMEIEKRQRIAQAKAAGDSKEMQNTTRTLPLTLALRAAGA